MGVLLLASVAAGVYTHHVDDQSIRELETQIGELREQEKQSAVDRRVSKQMEEIAYGQQILSEERSSEAIRQSEIAQEMTLRSEAERQKAIVAQGIAEKSAQEAKDAYQMAEHQRIVADEQRLQAEHAKLVADTLYYLSVGRTLGTLSYSIYQAGDTELGNMLAYASYLYTNDYGGDLFTPAVFQALTQSAGGRRSFSVHNGSVSCTVISPKDNHLLTTSTYGEIFCHNIKGTQLQTKRLMSDSHYCFRDGFASKSGKDYAISHTGHLVVADNNQTRVIYLEDIDHPFSLQDIHDGRQLLIVGENRIALFDIATDKIISTRRLNFHVVSTGRRDNKPLLFDNQGHMHLVNSLDDMTREKVPVSGQVTAYTQNRSNRLTAYGMADGTIWLINGKGKTYKLVEHLSQVTKLIFDGYRLYSSSYDGKLLFWMTSDSQINPITLFQSNSWLNDFTFTNERDYIWTGEHNGTVTEYLISLPKITQRLRQNVKRNFTQEEWDYYVGKGIPYRRMRNEE
jgi:hypothetical protein